MSFIGRGPRVSEEQKKRIPPGQYFTEKWPVLHYGSVPRVDLATWDFKVWGEVENPVEFDWAEFKALPRKKVHADIHCVTRWSRLDADFEGVAIQTILERARLKSTARFVIAHAEQGYTANLPLSVLDDDDVLLADVADGLAYDGQMALERWKSTSPDLIILDLNLPRLSGFKVCQQIRAKSEVPIIILSVLDEEEDIISGLKYGADDYIIKPFSPRQVIARAQAVLRRTQQQKVQNGILQAGGLTLYTSRNELHRGERVVARLTRLECQLMEILLLNYGQVVPTGLLIDAVWGPGRGERGMLKQLVYRLRHKLYTDPAHAVCLEAVSGAGYCLKAIEGSPEPMATAAPREPEEEQAF